MPNYQPVLFTLPADTSSVNLELKPYIRPFERILARAELAGLLPEISINNPFDEPADNYVQLAASAPAELPVSYTHLTLPTSDLV